MDHELSVTVSVAVERVQLSPHTHTFCCEKFEVKPFKIFRTPCGTVGAAQNVTPIEPGSLD